MKTIKILLPAIILSVVLVNNVYAGDDSVSFGIGINQGPNGQTSTSLQFGYTQNQYDNYNEYCRYYNDCPQNFYSQPMPPVYVVPPRYYRRPPPPPRGWYPPRRYPPRYYHYGKKSPKYNNYPPPRYNNHPPPKGPYNNRGYGNNKGGKPPKYYNNQGYKGKPSKQYKQGGNKQQQGQRGGGQRGRQ